MQFKMNRFSKAIKRGLVSTEGGTRKKALDLMASRCSELEAFGCGGRFYFRVLHQQPHGEDRLIPYGHLATPRPERRSGVLERCCCTIGRGLPECLTEGA